jgi:hypothetical protein
MLVLGGGLLYLVNYADRKSSENLDFFEEEISGLKEEK